MFKKVRSLVPKKTPLDESKTIEHFHDQVLKLDKGLGMELGQILKTIEDNEIARNDFSRLSQIRMDLYHLLTPDGMKDPFDYMQNTWNYVRAARPSGVEDPTKLPAGKQPVQEKLFIVAFKALHKLGTSGSLRKGSHLSQAYEDLKRRRSVWVTRFIEHLNECKASVTHFEKSIMKPPNTVVANPADFLKAANFLKGFNGQYPTKSCVDKVEEVYVMIASDKRPTCFQLAYWYGKIWCEAYRLIEPEPTPPPQSNTALAQHR